MFSEENYIPQPQFESASMLIALCCVTMIHQLFQGRACTNTILVKYQSAVVTVNIRSLKIVNEYDQEIPQSQTADNPVAP